MVVVWTREVTVALMVISSSMYFDGFAHGSETNPRFDLKFVGLTLWKNGVVPNKDGDYC